MTDEQHEAWIKGYGDGRNEVAFLVEALRLAHSHQESSDNVIARANAYYAFLSEARNV